MTRRKDPHLAKDNRARLLAASDREPSWPVCPVRYFSRHGSGYNPKDTIYSDTSGKHWHDATTGQDLVGPFTTEGEAFHAARKWAGQPTTDGPTEFEYHKHGG